MEALSFMDSFHFLRPWWLLSIPVWLFISYHLSHVRQQQNGWSALCDPALLTYLVGEATSQKQTSKIWLAIIMFAGVITSIALAGPVWKQLPQPVFQATSAMVLILDLSRSMDAQDVKPSRLIRAKQKLQDILAARTEGQTGLIVFAGSAFDVVPLTTDNQAILSLLSSLDTSMMPIQGSQASFALERAAAMLKRSAIQAGSVVMVCDGVDAKAITAAQSLSKAGHVVSILAAGTSVGAPIPTRSSNQGSGGFMKDNNGNIVLTRIDESRLTAVAAAGGGLFQYIQLDDSDVMRLPGLIPSHFSDQTKQDKHSERMKTDQWHEEGPWLVLLLLPLCALAFRRGVLLGLLLIPLMSMFASPFPSEAVEWVDLWQTPDQQAQVLMQHGKAKEAASLFHDPAWKAAAHYRAGEFQEAADTLATRVEPENQYNKANALARAGKLAEAIKAYDEVLKKQTQLTNTDAQFNRDLVEKSLKKKQQKNKQKNKKSDKNKKQSDKQNDAKNKQGNKPKNGKGDQQNDTQKGNKQSPDQQGENGQDQAKPDAKKPPQASDKRSKEEGKQTEQQKAPDKKAADKKSAKKDQPQNAADNQQLNQQSLEKQRAQQQMLRRIPDDPGGLLRRKFKYQYQHQEQQSGSQQAW